MTSQGPLHLKREEKKQESRCHCAVLLSSVSFFFTQFAFFLFCLQEPLFPAQLAANSLSLSLSLSLSHHLTLFGATILSILTVH